MLKEYISIIKITMLFFIFIMPVNGSVIIRMKVQQGPDVVNDVDNVYIKLFDELTPETVTNFLNYINDGDYSNSIVHRSIPDFIIQGGGFLFDSPNTFSNVPADAPVDNEFAKSNTLGTVAMAKLGEDPDSATSQWFVNLADNSANLDNQNGGFTVFGEIIGDGMSIINTMASVPVFDKTSINSAFGGLPLVGYTDGDDINFGNLVALSAMNEQFAITTDFGLTIIVGDSQEPEDVDFGIVTVGSVVVATITIENRHVDVLNIGAIANIDVLSIPYQIDVNGCDGVSLAQNETCNIIISFTPVLEGVFNDILNIEFTTLNLSYALNIHGESSLTSPENNIVVSSRNIEFDEIELYDYTTNLTPELISIQITNEGNIDLTIFPFSISTALGEYKLNTNDCLVIKNPIKPGESCELQIGFFPGTIGLIEGTFTINSDDPDEPAITIPITGSGSLDSDRVLTTIEDLGPNGGDGNNDDFPDSAQSNVISIDVGDGNYATIVVSEGDEFLDFTIVDDSQLVAPPGNGQLGTVYKFKQDFDQPLFGVGVAEFGIVLPADVIVETYFMYGPTNNDINPHWYEFLYDGTTGAQIFNNVKLTSPSGDVIQRTIIKLFFVDSLRGDGDLVVNGELSIQGAHVESLVASTKGDGSGRFDLIMFLASILIILYFRKNQYLKI